MCNVTKSQVVSFVNTDLSKWHNNNNVIFLCWCPQINLISIQNPGTLMPIIIFIILNPENTA